jgi:hypothetical protein
VFAETHNSGYGQTRKPQKASHGNLTGRLGRKLTLPSKRAPRIAVNHLREEWQIEFYADERGQEPVWE